MKASKRFSENSKKVDPDKIFKLKEAVELIKQEGPVKFDASVDIAFSLGVDAKQSEQMVRGTVSLPHGTGKTVKIVVFAKEADAKAATEAGADFVGFEDLLDKVGKGWVDFDVVIATPETMREVGKLGKVLGPKGLMPSPKAGTVTKDVAKTVKDVQAGRVEFKMDKAANVHAQAGKVSFSADQLSDNINTLVQAVLRAKPISSKGQYLKNLSVSSSMGPGIKLDLKEFSL